MTLAGDENVFGWVPAGDAQQFAAQEIDAVAVFRRQRDGDAVTFVVTFSSASGKIDLVIDGDTGE